jgi:ribonuclease HI
MFHLQVFTDGSVNTQLKVGYGAYFVLSDLNASIDSLKDTVKVRRFEQTSSTKLELQTLLWALSETVALTNRSDMVLTAYTDSQNIIGLPGRRDRLEQSNYFSSKNKRLNNYELYQEFYRLTSQLNCGFVKLAGHQASSKKDKIDRLFGLVDQASRRALREDLYAGVGRQGEG